MNAVCAESSQIATSLPSYSYVPYGVHCRVTADAEDLLAEWDRYFGSARIEGPADSHGSHALEVHLRSGGASDWGKWEVRLRGVPFQTRAGGLRHWLGKDCQLTLLGEDGTYVGHSVPEGLLEAWMSCEPQLPGALEIFALWSMRHFCELLRAHLPEPCHAVHGSAVGKDGRALLLLGSSGSGKTTLALSLAERGWTLLSDDLTILRFGAEAPLLLPLVLCVGIKRDALRLLPRLRDFVRGEMNQGDNKVMLPANRIRSVYATEKITSIELSALLFPTVASNALTEIGRLDRKAALIRLLTMHNPHDGLRREQRIQRYTNLVSSVPAFAVRSGRDAASTVEHHLSVHL